MFGKHRASLLALGLLLASTAAAGAATVSVLVEAEANSSAGIGVGKTTGVILTAGDVFSVSADPLDTWTLGDGPRTGNADGLSFSIFGNYTQGGLSTLFGTLVGRIGSGDFFRIGLTFAGPATSTGELLLYNWDSNSGDNSGSILATIETTVVANTPLPGALLMFGSGLLGLGSLRRKWRKAA